jgi:tRNA-modifying protein YgfZ
MGTWLSDRAVVRLSGEDVRGFLQGLVTNDAAGPLPVWTALLTPQGKALFDFLLWADGDDVLVDCEAEQADALLRRLSMYRLRRPITIARDDRIGVHWSGEGEAGNVDPRLPALGRRWIGAPGVPAKGWREHRLSLGVTEGVTELGSGETLWLECNARELNGVSFAKGCYVGQENTARMHHRAKVNRRLVVAPIDETDEKRRAIYPELGVMVTLRRVEALGDARVPDWMAGTLESA